MNHQQTGDIEKLEESNLEERFAHSCPCLTTSVLVGPYSAKQRQGGRISAQVGKYPVHKSLDAEEVMILEKLEQKYATLGFCANFSIPETEPWMRHNFN